MIDTPFDVVLEDMKSELIELLAYLVVHRGNDEEGRIFKFLERWFGGAKSEG